MAKIVILTHTHDLYAERSFLVRELSRHWAAAGHAVIVQAGPRKVPRADVGILHVDATVVPREYLEALGDCRVVINGATLDIGKRTYSENLVGPFDPYAGPVIVKTNANSGGVPEALHDAIARKRGEPALARPPRHMLGAYPVYPSLSAVPLELRHDPELVVEKFLPELDPRGYATRHYLFFGDRERCSRMVGPSPVVKAGDAIERTLVDVPDEIRAWRRKLGFDYGKLDFVVREGKPILIDANRTPTLPRGELTAAVREGLDVLSQGLDAFLR